VPDFEMLTRTEPSRLPLVPVLVGVVAGLILGLAGGYWLGSRNVTPAASPPAQVTTPARQEPPPAAPSGTVTGAAQPGPAPAISGAPQSASAPPPAAAEAAPPPPAVPAVRGSIQVTASQQANVYLDGQRQGMTPRSLRNVPLGRHAVRVTRPGYSDEEQVIVLTAEEPAAALKFTLRRAGAAPTAGAGQAPAVRSVLTVFIESTPPGARIRIDGRDLAPTPLTVRQLRPGTHTIELRLPGYRTWSQRITVAAGDNRRITATLERDNPR
jgi:serine/threonine-protein kinase